MNTAEVLPAPTTEHSYRQWQVIPDAVMPDYYTLETKGNVICTLIFPGNDTETDTRLLNRIAAAPELEDIAEMFRDSMTGKRAEKSMIFDMVRNVLSRFQ